jgi:hypothetical protein
VAQRPRGVGTVTLHAKRANGSTEVVVLEDIPNFREGVTILNDASHRARESLRVRETAQPVNYQGSPFPAAPAAPAVAAPSPASDLNAELERLAGFHQSGILTDEEFTAAKRKLLGL